MNANASRCIAVAAITTALCASSSALAVEARDFVTDGAGMFSGTTVAQLNARIGNFNAQTGKEVVVVTTPSLGAATLQAAASDAFAGQKVNGVLIFIARDDRRDIIVPDRAGARAGWFTPDVLRSIRTSMEERFRSGAYDDGIIGAVGSVLGVYRSHLGTLRQPNGTAMAPSGRTSSSLGGWHISMFWWIIIAVVGFLLVRSILRALAAPRPYGGAPGVPPGGVPPAGSGYGPGYGYGGYGGGGSFWSGLLGGLGGAFLGNELFRGGGGIGPADAGQIGSDGGGSWNAADSGGWQNDAGQADAGSASGGDWGGGGFGGDVGGGDMGGGGGDAGGGW